METSEFIKDLAQALEKMGMDFSDIQLSCRLTGERLDAWQQAVKARQFRRKVMVGARSWKFATGRSR
jgi:hypothetical protein